MRTISTLKVEVFADEVFVFTPTATCRTARWRHPIDFAYAIHSAVATSMVGAKVNGRIVTFDMCRVQTATSWRS